MLEDEATPSTGISDVIDVAQAAVTPNELDPSKPYALVIPDHHRVEVVLAAEQWAQALAPCPRRQTGHVNVSTLEALHDLLDRHAWDATTIWVSRERVEVVFNDHTAETPGWRDFGATFLLKPTPEWKHWTNRDATLTSQEIFAEHIEDGLNEIIEPDGATMLEIAQSFQASTSATFRSASRLATGQVNFVYEEEHEAKAGKSGQLEIPREFKLAIAPFDGELPVPIVARLRYRLRSGTLTIGYKLDRPDTIIRNAVKVIADNLRDKRKGDGGVFEGTP